MKNPSDAPKAIHLSYFLSAILKVLIGVLGALTFGSNTNSIVTLNASKMNRIAEIVFAISNIGFGVFNFPLCMFVVAGYSFKKME